MNENVLQILEILDYQIHCIEMNCQRRLIDNCQLRDFQSSYFLRVGLCSKQKEGMGDGRVHINHPETETGSKIIFSTHLYPKLDQNMQGKYRPQTSNNRFSHKIFVIFEILNNSTFYASAQLCIRRKLATLKIISFFITRLIMAHNSSFNRL